MKRLHFKGLLDTKPLPNFLRKMVSWKQISLNVQNEYTKAISLTVTNVHTGQIEHFIHRHPSVAYTGRHRAHYIQLELRHAMASAAIPLLFPSIRIGKNF